MMSTEMTIVPFPHQILSDPREKYAKALFHCLSMIAAEAEEEGFVLTAEALQLAIVILGKEAEGNP
ncbi:hypothetical protein [Telmatospirillum sp. J64-1]|uniref:hypothetical protein n=1 Tax=Telmatospirillum sp. J64-1 TaxID=2502183 RepID=UPI00115E7C5A|nr:hypothetical protein [Telmatospirillum sp. J64-1]